MRTKKPYELKVSTEISTLIFTAVREFCLELGRVPDPQPRLKRWKLGISSSRIVWGDPDRVADDEKFGIVYDFSDRENGVTPKQLQMMLFNAFVSDRVTKALMRAMVYAGDVEANGSNEGNSGLIDQAMAELYALSRESMDMGWF
jgi:hypothetical protein